MVVVFANRLTLDDLKSGALREFSNASQTALLAPSYSGPRTQASVMNSLAASARVRGTAEFSLILDVGEPFEVGTAGEAYTRRTGQAAPERGLVHLGIGQQISANRTGSVFEQLFLLGDELQKAEVPVSVFGDSDTPGTPRRIGASLFVGTDGIIYGMGKSWSDFLELPTAAGGKITHLAGAFHPAAETLRTGQLFLLEFGDLERIEIYRGSFTPEAYKDARRKAVDRLGRWLTALRHAEPHGVIVLISPQPPPSDKGRWDTLGLIIWNENGLSGNSLTSNTTRTRGLVAGVDFAPAVLAHFGQKPSSGMTGYRFETITLTGRNEALGFLQANTQRQVRYEFLILSILGGVAAGTGILSALYLVKREKYQHLRLIVLGLLTTTAWMPALLLAPLGKPAWVFLPVAGLLVSLGIVFTFLRKPDSLNPFLPVELAYGFLLTGLALSAFGFIDAVAMSVFSSFQMNGFRYYGMSNEYMSCLVGAAATIACFPRFVNMRPVWLGLWFTGWIFILGLPFLGANAGGAITATATFGLLWCALTNRSVGTVSAAGWTLGGVLLVFVFAGLDALVSGGAPSHFGAAIRSADSVSPLILFEIIERKLVMNVSVWARPETRVALVIAGTMLAVWWGFREQLAERISLDIRQRRCAAAIAIGALVSLLFNDSGISNAGLILCYLAMWLTWNAVASSDESAGLHYRE